MLRPRRPRAEETRHRHRDRLTRGGIDRLEVYRKLGVREVWIWEADKLCAHALRGDRYVAITGSEVLPELDLSLVERCLGYETQTEAVRAFRAALRG